MTPAFVTARKRQAPVRWYGIPRVVKCGCRRFQCRRLETFGYPVPVRYDLFFQEKKSPLAQLAGRLKFYL